MVNRGWIPHERAISGNRKEWDNSFTKSEIVGVVTKGENLKKKWFSGNIVDE